VTPALYLIDTSGIFRILQEPKLRQAWSDQLAAGVIATCPIVELEFLFPQDRWRTAWRRCGCSTICSVGCQSTTTG
jgi:hypothetical protein